MGGWTIEGHPPRWQAGLGNGAIASRSGGLLRELLLTFAHPAFPPDKVGVVPGQIESVIQFIDGDELRVQDTVDEIDRAIGDLRTGRVPLITVHGPDGRERRINAAHIKTVRRYDTSA